MAPAAILETIVDTIEPRKETLPLPEPARQRLTKAVIDLSKGYPYRPSVPLYLQDVYKIRNEERPYEDAGARADKSKKNLLSATTKVTDLTTHIGTEIEGLQLKDLTPEQRDELALLIAERSVVFFRNQDLTPQQQKDLGEWFGEVEVHPQTPQVPGIPGVTVIWPDLFTWRDRPTSVVLAVPRIGTAISSMSANRRVSPICTTTRCLLPVGTRSGRLATALMRSCRLSSARSSTASMPCTALHTHILIERIQMPGPSTSSARTRLCEFIRPQGGRRCG